MVMSGLRSDFHAGFHSTELEDHQVSYRTNSIALQINLVGEQSMRGEDDGRSN